MEQSEKNQPMTELICKPGELLLKSKAVRRAFSHQLIHNMRNALETIASPESKTVVRRDQASFTVLTTESTVPEPLLRVFGITAISRIHRLESDCLDEIVSEGQRFFEPAVAGKRFAVRCHRSGSTTFRSIDVGTQLGAALFSGSAGVELRNPEIVCRLDVQGSTVKFYAETIPAHGGLPIGTQGKAVALISGGIDSPVAAWYGLRRGLEVHYLFCCLGGPLQHWGPTATAHYLARHWSYGYRPKLYIADFNALLEEFKNLDSHYRNILLKRYLLRAADQLARHIGADAIITGESLGQVSSQTLSNLNTIDRVIPRLVLRPLIGFDKTEIMARAREIGTLSISEKVPEFCNIAVNKPRTRSHAEDLEILESEIDLRIADEACRVWRKFDLRGMDPPIQPEVQDMSDKPPGSWLVWIESPDVETEPPAGTDQIVNMLELSRFFKSFERTGIILFACPHGKLSADAAAIARMNGMDAYRLVH